MTGRKAKLCLWRMRTVRLVGVSVKVGGDCFAAQDESGYDAACRVAGQLTVRTGVDNCVGGCSQLDSNKWYATHPTQLSLPVIFHRRWAGLGKGRASFAAGRRLNGVVG